MVRRDRERIGVGQVGPPLETEHFQHAVLDQGPTVGSDQAGAIRIVGQARRGPHRLPL